MKRLTLALTVIVIMATCAAAGPLRLDVSSQNRYKTVAAALSKAREVHEQDPEREVIISLPPGYMPLAEPIVLGPQDSYVTLQGSPLGDTILGCGRPIRQWHPIEGRLWAADVPDVKEGKWDFRSLVINGNWRRRAYLPRAGFFEHLSEYKEPWRSTTGGGFGTVPVELKRTMIYKPEDLGSWLSIPNAELIIYHSWDMSHARIESNDVANHTLTLTPPLGYPAGAFGIHRYRVENVVEGMHTPGLWYLDRENGQVVYWPLPGEEMERAVGIAPVGTQLIKIEGTTEAPVRHLKLKDLILQDTNVPWKSPGFGAAGISESAVTLTHGRECALEHLRFRFLGGNAVKVFAGDSNRVTDCEVSHVGASGIIVSGAAEPGVGDNAVISDNHIHDVGLIYPAGIALRVGNVANARLCRNLIHDVGYCGITFGGDMKTPRAVNGLIENNHIYRVMTALNDGAAIYMSAQLDGTVVRGNVCHDIHGLTGMGWGIYPDEQCRFLTVTGNLVYRCLGSFHCHMAHDIKFENNIAINGDEYQVSMPKSSNISFAYNLFVCDGEPILHKNVVNPKDHVSQSDFNLFFDVSGGKPVLGKPTWEAWNALGLDTHSVFADPLFVDAAHGNYDLKPNSPAFKLGFVKLDLSKVPHEKE
jgi:hypothetical protein